MQRAGNRGDAVCCVLIFSWSRLQHQPGLPTLAAAAGACSRVAAWKPALSLLAKVQAACQFWYSTKQDCMDVGDV